MLNALPVLMIKNEEYWIETVLRPLITVFGAALVGDTGSTDRTREIVRLVDGAVLYELGEMNPRQLEGARQALGLEAVEHGAEWIFQVDGDELYSEAALRAIVKQGMPAGKIAGFTKMVSVSQHEHELWELEDIFDRLAALPATPNWNGECPSLAPSMLKQESWYHYFDLPAGLRYHAVHLSRLERSPRDAEVYLQGKERLVSMRDKVVVRTKPFDLTGWREGKC